MLYECSEQTVRHMSMHDAHHSVDAKIVTNGKQHTQHFISDPQFRAAASGA